MVFAPFELPRRAASDAVDHDVCAYLCGGPGGPMRRRHRRFEVKPIGFTLQREFNVGGGRRDTILQPPGWGAAAWHSLAGPDDISPGRSPPSVCRPLGRSSARLGPSPAPLARPSPAPLQRGRRLARALSWSVLSPPVYDRTTASCDDALASIADRRSPSHFLASGPRAVDEAYAPPAPSTAHSQGINFTP